MPTRLPSGVVTFLFTDVEGSTKLLHDLGPGSYAEALAEHRRILREAFSRNGGVEVDTQGDAFFVAFPTAAGALAAAGEAVERLGSGPIRVRIGIHTGAPHLGDEGYVGVDVHRAARIGAAGHGGQVVVSAATASLLGSHELRDLGEHRLKDFDEPVPLYQLGLATFPPLKTISNTNLPRPASSFVGRETEISEVVSLLQDGARLLTLTGPGGSGKTRLAIEAAAELVPSFKAGVFWVGLAPLRDPLLVTETIARALGAKDGLVEHIGGRELMLLLDNLEQVVEAAAELASLVEACPNLTVVVTSRELLRVRGEVEYPVRPLALTEGVELFCARARTRPDETIRELCAALDNLPLALELAAARVNLLAPRQILERVTDRLDLLRGGRDADPRQQTLRATMEWSHDLLDREEQELFARLAVFRGGCTVEAAELVVDADLNALQSLVEKSLLRRTDERLWMLETIRDFAAEKLEASPEARQIRRRHAEYFLSHAEQAEPTLWGGDEMAMWLNRLDAEMDNMRAALSTFSQSRSPEPLMRLASALSRYWYLHGPQPEGQKWLEQALERAASAAPRLRGKLLDGLAAVLSRDLERARVINDERLALYRDLGDGRGLALALNDDGLLAEDEGDIVRARRLLEESIAVQRASGTEDRQLFCMTLFNLGCLAMNEGDYDVAESAFRETLVASQDLHGTDVDGQLGLGQLAIRRGRYEEAGPFLRSALSRAIEVSFDLGLPACLEGLAAVIAAAGRPEEAARLLGAADAIRETIGSVVDRADAPIRERARSLAHAQLSEGSFRDAWDEGRRMATEQAVELAFELTAMVSPL